MPSPTYLSTEVCLTTMPEKKKRNIALELIKRREEMERAMGTPNKNKDQQSLSDKIKSLFIRKR